MAAIERYPVVLKFDGLAAGKGVVIAQDEAQARAALEEFLEERRFGPGPRRRRGAPRRRGALAARALRRRARDPDGARAGLQADLRRRRGPEHRRDGLVLARSPASTRPRARAVRGRPPADRRRARAPRHAVPRRALRGDHADRRRAAGARVQRALRRSRDPGRAAAPAQRPRSSWRPRPRTPGGLSGVELDWDPRTAVTLVLASAGYPDAPRSGDVDHRPRRGRRRTSRSRTPAPRSRTGGS